MKILAICGSPRSGNTEFMMKTVLEEAKGKAETEFIFLKDLKIEHCTGCNVCESSKPCPIQDDMPVLFTKMLAADVILFGSPSYFNNVTGLMKDFIDRSNPAYTNKSFEGKKVAYCVTGSQPMHVILKCTDVFLDYFHIMGMEFMGGVASKDNELKSKLLMQEMKKLGKVLAK